MLTMCIRRAEEMTTITDLKEHLEKGGKIRRSGWQKGEYICLNDDYDEDLIDEDKCYFCDKQILSDDWEVYKEPKKKFEITHTGLYKTRKGRKAFVSCEVKYPTTLKAPFFGIVEGGLTTRWWTKTGKNLCEPFEDGKEFDIVSEWES